MYLVLFKSQHKIILLDDLILEFGLLVKLKKIHILGDFLHNITIKLFCYYGMVKQIITESYLFNLCVCSKVD